MIFKHDLSQPRLLSRFDDLLSGMALKKLERSWQGLFRRTILALVPVDIVEGKFSRTMGCPTKELYSICGLLLMMEFFAWSEEEALLAYMTRLDVQYALNIESDKPTLSIRTLERYRQYLRKKDFAQASMNRITEALIKELGLDLSEQRLDSTHVLSNMASWTRKRLLFEVIKSFLKQVKRHDGFRYEELDKELRERYEHNNGWIFGETSPIKLQRNGKVYTTEEQLGYDMETLMRIFCGQEKFSNMTTYKDLVRVFTEQFTSNDGKAELKAHTGGKVLVNPSDRDAEVGHKGVGYQVQVTESCSAQNEIQLVTNVLPQGASASDMTSLPAVVEKLKELDRLPGTMLADQGYGSDGNYVECAENGVNLQAPTPPKPKNKVGLDECEFDAKLKMLTCPAGGRPMKREYSQGKGRALFHQNICDKCPLKTQCRVQKQGKQNYVFSYTDADLRTRERRKFEATSEFKEKYPRRGGIEGLFGRLKQFTQLRRLRCRGQSAVYCSIYAIFTMHNVMQAAGYVRKSFDKALAAVCLPVFVCFRENFRRETAIAVI